MSSKQGLDEVNEVEESVRTLGRQHSNLYLYVRLSISLSIHLPIYPSHLPDHLIELYICVEVYLDISLGLLIPMP